jgi:hypothetical protein
MDSFRIVRRLPGNRTVGLASLVAECVADFAETEIPRVSRFGRSAIQAGAPAKAAILSSYELRSSNLA